MLVLGKQTKQKEQFWDEITRQNKDKTTQLVWRTQLCRPKRVLPLPGWSSQRDRLVAMFLQPTVQRDTWRQFRKVALQILLTFSDVFDIARETKSKRMSIKRFEQFELQKRWIDRLTYDEVNKLTIYFALFFCLLFQIQFSQLIVQFCCDLCFSLVKERETETSKLIVTLFDWQFNSLLFAY